MLEETLNNNDKYGISKYVIKTRLRIEIISINLCLTSLSNNCKKKNKMYDLVNKSIVICIPISSLYGEDNNILNSKRLTKYQITLIMFYYFIYLLNF